MTQFDRIIQAFMMITMPNVPQSGEEVSLMATGLNGYVTHIIIRWVSEGFKRQPLRTFFVGFVLCSIPVFY